MQIISTLAELNQLTAARRQSQQTLAFVPTMGNLHRGHLSLVQHAKNLADQVMVSIFVNPLQFAAHEDLNAYPRTLSDDIQKLEQAGVDFLFAPTHEVIYPHDMNAQTRVHVPVLSDILCGETRPGHFTGVATVVAKLFNLTQPDVAVFGEKDFQQLLIVRQLVKDLSFPLEIIGVATERENDGLALSSRNQYLNSQEREIAPQLYRALQMLAEKIKNGERDYSMLIESQLTLLNTLGFKPDYLKICKVTDLSSASVTDKELVILVAAFLGKTRLIDNLRVFLPH